MATTNQHTVTRTERKGRFIYSVDGAEVRTAAKAYGFATVGMGNPHDPSGYYLTLHTRPVDAHRTASRYPEVRFAEIQTGA